jgi:hypothetical protein
MIDEQNIAALRSAVTSISTTQLASQDCLKSFIPRGRVRVFYCNNLRFIGNEISV